MRRSYAEWWWVKGFPSTLAGWVIFYLFVMAETLIIVWAFIQTDIPQGVANVLIAIVSGFLGLLTGRAMEIASNASVKTETTTTTVSPPEDAGKP